MARLRTDFVRGTITNNPLAAGDATLTSAALASLPEVASPDIAVLILDPAASAPEVVHVTAHTAAATSATILRGREGSSARSHIQGTAFVHGLTGDDLPANAFPASVSNGDILYGVAASDEYSALAKPATPAGHLLQFATGASAPAWLTPGTAGYFLRVNAAGTALEYAAVSTLAPVGALHWIDTPALAYVAHFGATELKGVAGSGFIMAEAGWTLPATPVESGSTGDINALTSDYDPNYAPGSSGSYLESPAIVLDRGLIALLESIHGITIKSIDVIWIAKMSATTASTGAGIALSPKASSFGVDSIRIYNGVTNFTVAVFGGAGQDTGVAKDTQWHRWRMHLDLVDNNVDVYLDESIVVTAQALSQDKWPLAVTAAGDVNYLAHVSQVGFVHREDQ